MSATAREILTRLPASDGRPLFANAQDLGRRIAEIPPDHGLDESIAKLTGDRSHTSTDYHNRPKQAGNFLNMVLVGIKPCPPKLRNLIATCIRQRLGPDRSAEAETWIRRLDAAFSQQKAVEREAKLESSETLAAAQYLEEAAEVLIALPAPHDEFELRSDKVLERCFSRLGITTELEEDSFLSVTICLATEEQARREAELLIRTLKRTLADDPRSGGDAALKAAVEGGLLRVVCVKQASTMIPFVAFDIGDRDRMAAFCYTVNRHGRSGFLRLPRSSGLEILISYQGELRSEPANKLALFL